MDNSDDSGNARPSFRLDSDNQRAQSRYQDLLNGLRTDAALSRSSNINLNYVSPYLYRSAVYARYRTQSNVRASRSHFGKTDETEDFYVTVSRSKSLTVNNTRKITVIKSRERYDQLYKEIPTYQTRSEHRRGKMLIINNIMYGQRSYRRGAQQDEENLVSVFGDMGFDIIKHQDLKGAAVVAEIEKFRDRDLAESPDIMVFAFMSHGNEGRTVTNTTIFSADDQALDIEDIVQMFDEIKCKSMAGKPKIFIFQCCRGDGYHIQVDGEPLKPKAALHDALIAHSTLPGFVSYRDAIDGSWYIKTLCEVFAEYAHKHDVETLLTMIDSRISQKYPQVQQRSHFENRSFKKCYLHPI